MPSSQTLYRAAMLPSKDIGNVTAETQFSDGRSALLKLPLPSNNSLANRSFRVRILGRCATTTNTTLELLVYLALAHRTDPSIQKQLGMPFPVGKNTLLFNQPVYEGTVRSSGKITINYDTLLPGPRGFGGCSFDDETQPGSYMPVISRDDSHITIHAAVGHKVHWDCRWNIRRIP